MEVLLEAYDILKSNNVESYRLDSQLILSYVLKRDKIFLITNKNYVLNREEYNLFMDLINLRKQKMPVKYILKECEFMGIDFYIEEGVLIPRPDTEILVETSINEINKNGYIDICDMCCGSGIIGLSLSSFLSNINVDCVDISKIAGKVTEKNINKLHLEKRVRFIESNLFQYIKNENKKYHMIISNPPYIREAEIRNLMEDVKDYEPYDALNGGIDGLYFYREIIKHSLDLLYHNGALAFEIGYDQGEEVSCLMKENGFKKVKVIKDLADKDRVVKGTM